MTDTKGSHTSHLMSKVLHPQQKPSLSIVLLGGGPFAFKGALKLEVEDSARQGRRKVKRVRSVHCEVVCVLVSFEGLLEVPQLLKKC